MSIQTTIIARHLGLVHVEDEFSGDACTNAGIVRITRQGECCKCTSGQQHAPEVSASPDCAVLILEGGHGSGVGTSQYNLFNDLQMLIWEAGQ
jgi:hypothetical protein